jgi:2-polyprenyl-3-methyl-5-hydroxy-6-metoxy-1,4-benzoquinol methylase
MEMAMAYPRTEFHGYDSSDVAIRLAKENRAASGLDDVIFHPAPASALEPNGSFDFVLTAELLLRGTPLKDGRTTPQTDDASRHANAGR